MLFPIILLSAGGYYLFQSSQRAFDAVMEEVLEELVPTATLQKLVLRSVMPTHDYLIHGKREERRNYDRISEQIDRHFNTILKLTAGSPAEYSLLEAARVAWEEADQTSRSILALPAPRSHAGASELMEQYDQAIDHTMSALSQAHRVFYEEIEQHHAHAKELKTGTRALIIVMLGLGLAVAALSGYLLARSILIPLRKLETGAQHLAEGHLDYRVELNSGDELGQLAVTFNDMAEQIENLAGQDSLTGLYNFREFERRLNAEFERSSRYGPPITLMMIDADHFKNINDTYGHMAGDEVLRELGELLLAQVRPTDHVARYGGEELAVILPETDSEAAMTMAERVRHKIEQHLFPIGYGQTVNMTVSIGLATFPAHADDREQLVAAADKALYAAKSAGRNQVHCFLRAKSPAS
jgi:diguanylate cyclase (GGDEF)-like protein